MFSKVAVTGLVLGLALAQLATARRWNYTRRDEQTELFNKLVSLRSSDDPEVNYSYATKSLKLNPFVGPDAKELVRNLKTIGAAGCTPDTLEALVYFRDQSVKYFANTKLEKVLRMLAERHLSVAQCMETIRNEHSAALGRWANRAKLAALLEQLDADVDVYRRDRSGGREPAYETYLSDSLDIGYADRLAAIANELRQLAKGDPRAECQLQNSVRQVEQVDANLEYALDRYLVQPCREYTAAMGKPFEWLRMLADAPDALGLVREHVVRQPEEFKRDAYHYKRCASLIEMDEETRLAVEDFYCGNRSGQSALERRARQMSYDYQSANADE